MSGDARPPTTRDALVALALAGTGRRDPAPDPTEPWAAALPADDAERALLLRAGAHAVAGLAGRRPAAGVAPVPAAPRETLAPCAAGAAAYVLALAREADTRPVALEALSLMRARALRLPHGLLPEALDTGDPALQAALAPVLGARGPWLASFRADWAWACATAADETPGALRRAWEEGTPAERLKALVRQRAHDPAEARAWVLAAGADKADQRVRYVQALAVGLSAEDEPVLARALTDRAPSVRQAAARLLARLPASAFGAAMAARADTLVGGDLARGLTLTPPEALPEAWALDGIEAKPPGGIGPRAWWLGQLLELVPLGHWERRFGAPAAALAPAFGRGEWGLDALGGLGGAALSQEAPAWIQAVHDALLGRTRRVERGPGLPPHLEQVFQALVPRLPGPRLASLALDELRAAEATRYVHHLAQLPRPWEPAFSEALLTALGAHLDGLSEAYRPFSDPWLVALGPAALGLDPLLEARVPPLSEQDRPAARPLMQSLERLRSLLALRRRLLEEIVP